MLCPECDTVLKGCIPVPRDKLFLEKCQECNKVVMFKELTHATWIRLNECVDGWLYIISARNSTLGIFDSSRNGFIISRFKFNDNYLFTEDHWDVGEHYGTVKPLKAVEFVVEKDLLAYLNKKMLSMKDEINSLINPEKLLWTTCDWTERGWTRKE